MMPWFLTNWQLLTPDNIWQLIFELEESFNVQKCLSNWVFTGLGVEGIHSAPIILPLGLTLMNVMLHDKQGFAEVIKVTNQLTWKYYPGSPTWSHKPWKAEIFSGWQQRGNQIFKVWDIFNVPLLAWRWGGTHGKEMGSSVLQLQENWILPTNWMSQASK